MQPWEIHINDWIRIVFGNVPPEFFIELLIRLVFVYVLVLCCIRLMGKRMAAQLTRNETVAIASLAASIGIPIQSPERGLLPGLIVALLVVAAQRLISGRFSRNEKFERRSQGNLGVLIVDHVIQPEALKKSAISRDEILARLRNMKIIHLGQVRRLYFESDGDFTLIDDPDEKPGLNVLPAEDPQFRAEQPQRKDIIVCSFCGARFEQEGKPCHNCGETACEPAVSSMV